MHDPQLVAKSQAQDPAAPWEKREAFKSLTIATGTDHTNSAGRAVVEDGRLVRTETAGATMGSTRDANEAQYREARLPFDYAVDPRTQCRVSPLDLKEDSIVYFGEASMTIAQARQAGFLSPDWRAPGTRPHELLAQRDASKESVLRAEAPASHKAEQDHSELRAEGFSNTAIESELSTIVNNTGGFEQVAAIEEIIENGAVDENTLSTLATQLAIEPTALSEKFAPIMAEFEKQGRAAFSAGGLDADEVISWAQKNRPDALTQAMRKQATQRSTAGYSALRNEFLANLGESNPARAPAADLGPGVTTYLDKGRVVVRLSSGEEMLWKTALEAFGPK